MSLPSRVTRRPMYPGTCHTVFVFASSLADATPILGTLEARSAVVLPSPAPTMPIAFPTEFVCVDQEGYAYAAHLVKDNRTKVFAIPLDEVIGAKVHSGEGAKKYFSKTIFDV